MRNGTLSLVVALTALSSPTFGDVSIVFGKGTLSPSGTVAVIADNAIGTNIPFQTMTVSGDPGFDGEYDLFGLGPSGAGFTQGSALFNFNTASGAFTLTGGVCVLGVSNCISPPNVLVNLSTLTIGTGSSATIISLSNTQLSFSESSQFSASLLTALGLSSGTLVTLQNSDFTYGGTTSPYSITDPTLDFATVPEPSSLVLLFLPVAAMAIVLLRRKTKANY